MFVQELRYKKTLRRDFLKIPARGRRHARLNEKLAI
jgi:hypothetical protein